MNNNFSSLNHFQNWFWNKLVNEKNRRIEYIKSIWDSLSLEEKEDMIKFVGNDSLCCYKNYFINKQYENLYSIFKDQFELSYELIYEWVKQRN